MARPLLPDEVWQRVAPLLPEHPVRPRGGRPLIQDRDVLTGILFMLKTGIAWEDLPSEMQCGCGMTCLRRLREWQQQGVWPRIREVLEVYLPEAKRIEWSRAEGRNTSTSGGQAVSSRSERSAQDTNVVSIQSAGPLLPSQRVTASISSGRESDRRTGGDATW